MASYNKIILMGNVTKTPELRSIPGSNTTVARTGLAVNRKYKEKEEVMFVDIVAFGRNAEVMGEYIAKGSPLLIEGRLSMNSWEQPDGAKRVRHEVIVDTFQMIGSKKDSRDSDYSDSYQTGSNDSYQSNTNNTSSSKDQPDMIDEDDVPF